MADDGGGLLREAAVGYVRAGWAVLPLWPLVEGTEWTVGGLLCACPEGGGCNRAGKHPRLSSRGAAGWGSVLDVAGVEQVWGKWPDAGIGVDLGGSADGDGLVVLDADTPGSAYWLQARAAWDAAPVSVTGKGLHAWYRCPHSEPLLPTLSRLRVASRGGPDGLEVRGGRAFVVAPPSPHRSGDAYAWLDGRAPVGLPEVPEDLMADLWGFGGDPDDEVTVVADLLGVSLGQAAVLATKPWQTDLTELLSRVRRAEEGSRNDELNRCCWLARGLLVLFGEKRLTAEFTAVGLAAGLGESEVERTVRSGLGLGR